MEPRTFVQPLNYGNAIIKAEPVAANRTSGITLMDVRTEKRMTIARAQVFGFYGRRSSPAGAAFESARAWTGEHKSSLRLPPT